MAGSRMAFRRVSRYSIQAVLSATVGEACVFCRLPEIGAGFSGAGAILNPADNTTPCPRFRARNSNPRAQFDARAWPALAMERTGFPPFWSIDGTHFAHGLRDSPHPPRWRPASDGRCGRAVLVQRPALEPLCARLGQVRGADKRLVAGDVAGARYVDTLRHATAGRRGVARLLERDSRAILTVQAFLLASVERPRRQGVVESHGRIKAGKTNHMKNKLN
eukprot:gene6029-biopygen16336